MSESFEALASPRQPAFRPVCSVCHEELVLAQTRFDGDDSPIPLRCPDHPDATQEYRGETRPTPGTCLINR